MRVYIISTDNKLTDSKRIFFKREGVDFKIKNFNDSNFIEILKDVKSSKEPCLIINDYILINPGIIGYVNMVIDFFKKNRIYWDALFLNENYKFWEDQKNIFLPQFSNCYGGFGNYISNFLIKKIISNSKYSYHESGPPLSNNIYLINNTSAKKIIETMSKTNQKNVINILFENRDKIDIFISNPHLKLFNSKFELTSSEEKMVEFIYPKKHLNIFDSESIDFRYILHLKVSDFFFKDLDQQSIISNLKLKLNKKEYPIEFLVSEDVDYGKSKLAYILRFGLPEDIKKLEKNMKPKEIMRFNNLEVVFNHPYDPEKCFRENLSFNLVKKIDIYSKYR